MAQEGGPAEMGPDVLSEGDRVSPAPHGDGEGGVRSISTSHPVLMMVSSGDTSSSVDHPAPTPDVDFSSGVWTPGSQPTGACLPRSWASARLGAGGQVSPFTLLPPLECSLCWLCLIRMIFSQELELK